jgi:glycosyltransferase involved in cell wall biosynthesis
MKKILMVGPFPEPVHGQSMANQILFDGLNGKGYRVENINTALLSKIESTQGQKKFSLRKLFIAFSKLIGELFKMLFGNYDLVYITPGHSFLGFMRYSPYILMCLIKRKPYFLHSHGGQLGNTYRDASGFKKSLLRFFIKRATGAIVLGDSLKWMFQGLVPPDKIFVCHNGVPKDVISKDSEINQKLSKKSQRINLLYLSNLMEEKGILDIFKSLKYFKENNFEFTLKIAGNIEKNLEKEIMNFLEDYKEDVAYLGIVQGEKKRKLLLESDIFLLPTYYSIEGQPISILESMINGCAIITTDQGGIGDIFTDNVNGRQCRKKDPYSIYSAVINVSKDLKRFQKINYEIAINKHTQNNFIERLENIIINFKI